MTDGIEVPGCGTLSTQPDLQASFDYLRYQRTELPAHLAGQDLADPTAVSDADLPSFLGDHANTPGTAMIPGRILSPQYQPGTGFSMIL